MKKWLFRPMKVSPVGMRILEAITVFTIIVVGLIIRIVLAFDPGFEFDIGVNQGWGRSAVELGLSASYLEQVNGNMLPNYAPFSIMLFQGMAFIQQQFFGGFEGNPLSYRILIKLPAIFADIFTVIFFYWICRKWKGRRAGLIAATVYALHPAVLHDSATWGQTDSIFTLFMVMAVGLFAIKRPLLASIMFSMAVYSKMQAVVLVPFFVIMYVRGGFRTFLDGLLGALLVTIPIMLPFALGGTLEKVIDVYINSVGFYSIVSSAAYNFWWALHSDAAGTIDDTSLLFNVISYRNFGLLMFGLSYLYTLILLWRHLRPSRTDFRGLPAFFVATAFLCLSFFMWNTQMHERYLFPFVALGLPMIFLGRRPMILYALVSLFFYINLAGWLPVGPVDRALFEQFPAFDTFIASLQFVTYCYVTVYLFLYMRTTKAPAAPAPASRMAKIIRKVVRRRAKA